MPVQAPAPESGGLLSFGEWAPDLTTRDTTYVTNLSNVFPGENAYHPVKGPQPYARLALPTQPCVGATFARRTDGSWVIYAGSQTKLYRFNTGTLGWTDVTRTTGGNYSVALGNAWFFQQFGKILFAINPSDVLQQIDLDTGFNFSNTPGSPPQGAVMGVVKDQLIIGALQSGGFTKRHIQWSGFNDTSSWVPGIAGSDVQEFPDGGSVTGICGGEFGYILQEQAIRRMTQQPSSIALYEFNRVEDRRGCFPPGGFSMVANTVFFLGLDGFYSYGNQGLSPIGSQRVNNFFFADCDSSRVHRVRCSADPFNPRIYWAYFRSGTSTYYDGLIIYDWLLDRWTRIVGLQGQAAAPLGTASVGLEDLNVYGPLESVPYSLDSPVWQGGKPVLAMIDQNGFLSFFQGPNLEATIETSEHHLNAPNRAFVNGVYPLIDSAGVMISLGWRHRMQDAVLYTGESDIDSTGWSSFSNSGRTHTVKIRVPAADVWSGLVGMKIDFEPDGEM